jgi:RNA polymerase sigma factor (sigma-70 family)
MHPGQQEERMPATQNPTFDEWYRRHDPLVRRVIHKLVPRYLGDPDDLSQEIWSQFCRGQVDPETGCRRSYLDIYDPTKAAETTYMWEFARLRCLQHLSRADRTPTARALSIQSQPSEEFILGIVDPEATPELGFDERVSIELRDLIDRAHAAVRAVPQRGKRDLRYVWALISRGYNQEQIAKEMNLSEGTISICMSRIREIPEVAELANYGREIGIVADERKK